MSNASRAASDAALIRRAIRVAMDGRGRVEPNPMVGCVIARETAGGAPVIIGEGRHLAFGHAHAEPTALANCREDSRGATAYVTLEPCCHTNKKTPPCVPRLIAAGIARVVVGCLDPNPHVNGKGVAMLRAAGITVDHASDDVEAECLQLIAPFMAAQSRRPYVTAKWAETADGKIAGGGGRRLAISGAAANHAVHALRARCDAILVGVNTVIADDPLLTARGVTPLRTLRRWAFDRSLRTPPSSRLVRTASDVPTTIFYQSNLVRPPALAAFPRDVKLIALPAVTIAHAVAAAGDPPITHLLIEPGPTLAHTLFTDYAVDRLWVIRSPMRVNDDTAPAAPPVPEGFVATATLRLGDDTLTEYLNTKYAPFYAATPSADMTLLVPSPGTPGEAAG